MLNNTEQQKIRNFLADAVLSNAVKKVLNETYLKESKNTDVNTLAAERIAINKLGEAWKELEKYSKETKHETKDIKQVGL